MSEEDITNLDNYPAKDTIKWATLENVTNLTFLGKDILAIHDKLHIYFFDIINGSYLVYNATSVDTGDGIECLAAHQTTQIFVFAEACKFPKIFLLTYPEFKSMRVIKDSAVDTYSALGLTELEQVVSLSAYPSYLITVWCWRTNRKLISCNTGIRSPSFFFRCSLAQSMIFHGWDKKYCIWEVAPYFKSCMFLQRHVHGNIPKIVDVTWTLEGNVYCIDKEANLYSILSDGIGMVVVKEWSSINGPYLPALSHFKNGLVIYGPELELKHLIKVNKEWVIDWSCTLESPIVKMQSGGLGEILIAIHEDGNVVKINYENGVTKTEELCFWQRSIKFIGVLSPFGNSIVTVNNKNLVCLWSGLTGQLYSRTQLRNEVHSLQCSPIAPMIAMCVESLGDYGVCVLQADTILKILCSINLTQEKLNDVIWSASGNELIASALGTGQVFFLKYKMPPAIDVINMIDIKNTLVNCWTMNIGKDLHFMGIALIINVYTNIPEKVILCYNFLTSKEISTFGRVEPTLSKVLHLKDNLLIGINTFPKQLQIFSVVLEDTFLKFNCEELIPMDFEISGLSFGKDKNGVVMWGMDGVIIYKTSVFKPEIKFKIKANHFLDKSLRMAILDPQQRYAACLNYNGALTVHNVQSNQFKATDGPGKFKEPEKNTIPDILADFDETWIQKIESIKQAQEYSEWFELRNSLERDFSSLHERLLVLLEDNISAPPLHQLPLNIFNLHLDAQVQREKKAAEEREKVREALEEQIVNQDKVTEWIKEKCWQTMDIVGKELHAIFIPEFVENYALNPPTKAQQDMKAIVKHFRLIESMQDENVFKPWIPPSSQEVSLVESAVSIKSEAAALEDVNASGELKEESSDMKSVQEFIHQITGSSAHLYIVPLPHSYIQMLAQSNLQMRWQTTMTEENTYSIKVWFNKQFDSVMSNKEKELSVIEEKNKRLNVIISELNILNDLRGREDHINICIRDPEWVQEEIPNKLVSVEQDEVDVTPYVSPSQVVIPPPDLGPKDDFREKALMHMMDGVLEKLWYEEIKKTIPKPQCMLTKDPEDYSEEDLKLVFEWEKSVEFRNEERETYRKMLRAEYGKLSSALNEMISKFNRNLKDFFLLKLKVESAIGQENLKLMRLRVGHLDRSETVQKMQDLELQIVKNELDLERNQKEIQDIQAHQTDCLAAYEALMARDRNLDKNLKANFTDVSPIVQDLCFKLFKKRPKWQQRASMTAGVLYEMATACLTKEKPEFLHIDCHEFLKALDQLDLLSNMPPVMDETIWANMCKLRRIKVDNEIKIKAAGAEIAEVEAAYGTWLKRSSNLKLAGQRMKLDQGQLRSNLEATAKNVYIQIVMKSGIVETEMTGHAEDFDNAVLIMLQEVDAINVKILEAGQLKLKALRQTTSFKKHILSMEWEHAALKMKLRHLQQDLYDLERIKVTKEVRTFLHSKIKKSILNNAHIESQINNTKVSFENQVYGFIHRVEELEMRIGEIKSCIDKTDDYLAKLKIKVSEKHYAEDPAAKSKKLQIQAMRMEAMVSRSRLLSDVQKQYIAIVLLQTELELQRLRTFPTLSMANKNN